MPSPHNKRLLSESPVCPWSSTHHICWGMEGGSAGGHEAQARHLLGRRPQPVLFFLPGSELCFPWASLTGPGRPIPRASPDPGHSFTRIERALPAG